jgi:N6-L-threonylcarbamoyladenine synthase
VRTGATFGLGRLVLGIETSCDETASESGQGTTMLANVISSSMDEHARYMAVSQPEASRAPRGALGPAAHGLLAEAGDAGRTRRHRRDERTSSPVRFPWWESGRPRRAAIALDKPIYAVNHLVGHGADGLRDDGTDIQLPTIALLVSGRPYSLLHVRGPDRRRRAAALVRRSTMRQVEPSTRSPPGSPLSLAVQIDRGGGGGW